MVPLHKLSFEFGSISLSFFLAPLVQSSCQIVPVYIFTLDLRSDEQTRESGATLDDKAAFASLSALSFPKRLTCEGIHAMIIWICDGTFF